MATAVRNGAWQGILTPRQAEVLELVALGYTDAMVAAEHGTSEFVVHEHLRLAYRRLGIRDGNRRVQVARWWIENVERATMAA
jgi:DNA-binding NarL/FixJ family response regulator